jgi:hypothetical protein
LAWAATLASTACSSSPPAAPQATIELDTSSCEARLETVLSVPPSASGTAIEAFAVADDDTVYYARSSVAPDANGIFAIAPGGAPVKISDSVTPGPIWVDGDQLVIARFGGLYTMPRAGGTPKLVAEVPRIDGVEPPLDGQRAYALDAKNMYVGMNDVDKTFTLWAVPRAGGAATVLFRTSDAAYAYAWNRALQMDADSLYLVADGGTGYGPLVRFPKAGGAPETVRPDVGVASTDDSILWGGALYSETGYTALTRYPLSRAEPSTTFAGADGKSALATILVADERGAYAGLTTGPTTRTGSRVAIAPIPTGTDHASLLACTPSSGASLPSFVTSMAITRDYVYALADLPPTDGAGDGYGTVIYRAARGHRNETRRALTAGCSRGSPSAAGCRARRSWPGRRRWPEPSRCR